MWFFSHDELLSNIEYYYRYIKYRYKSVSPIQNIFLKYVENQLVYLLIPQIANYEIILFRWFRILLHSPMWVSIMLHLHEYGITEELSCIIVTRVSNESFNTMENLRKVWCNTSILE
jgi:hypothetical protein